VQTAKAERKGAGATLRSDMIVHRPQDGALSGSALGPFQITDPLKGTKVHRGVQDNPPPAALLIDSGESAIVCRCRPHRVSPAPPSLRFTVH
jgi:hypothetical protein